MMSKTKQKASHASPMRSWSMLALVCIVQFVLVLSVNIVNIALPSIQQSLGFSQENLQWVLSSYVLTFGCFLILAGRAADLFGRRQLFMAGLVLFVAASVLCGFAPSQGMLIGARALQGLGAAIVSPTALSILNTTFQEGVERNRALGAWGAAAPLGGVVGLLLGGVLTGALGWRWTFFVNVPIVALALALAPKLLPENRDHAATIQLDLWGALTITIGLFLLVISLTQIESAGLHSVLTISTLVAGLVFIVAFCAIESRVASPLVPFRLFHNRALTIGNLVTLIMIAAFEPCGFFVTLYMQRVLHYSPFATSLAFLPLLVTLVVAPILGSWLTNLRGIRFTMVSGLTALAAGMLPLARISVNGSYLDTLLPGFLCIALGLGFTSVASTVAGTTNVQAQEQGLASGLINTSTQIGTALGLAILVTIAATRTSVLVQGGVSSTGALVEGFQWAFLSGALIAGMGIFVVLFVNMKEIAGSGKKIADRKKVDRF